MQKLMETSCNMLCKNSRRLGLNANALFVKAVLGLEGKENQHGYESSWFSILFLEMAFGRGDTCQS
ncbi:hypothetical protein [uncultured Sphaerochaeta sp.]|uniref:hypothetical protein n=1 Tax=uncultured Sphaerochaeta sp. TaxID=886478 RepID=UPI002A0A1703|nr:hypothetical protein [uncultured Sphaerochaeta sp.]